MLEAVAPLQALSLADHVLTALDNGILVTDPRQYDNPIIYCNDAFERLTGYSQNEALGRNFRFLHGPDTAPDAIAAIRKAVSHERHCRIVIKNYRKDGTPFWNELSLSPVHDDLGRITHTIGILNDVTSRKRVQDHGDRMLEVTKALSSTVTPAGVADAALEAAMSVFQAQAGIVAAISEDGSTLRAEAAAGPTSITTPWMSFRVEAPYPLAIAVRERRLVVSSLCAAPANRSAHHLHDDSGTGDVFVAVPLISGDRCIGGLGLLCAAEYGEDAELQAFLWMVAGQCALALERAHLSDAAHRAALEISDRKTIEERQRRELEEAKEYADRDPLTGLLNHRAFHKRLEELTELSEARDTAFAVVIVDVRDFKFFNDAYGHVIGDDALLQIAEKLQTICRAGDTIARYGGDEFAILLRVSKGVSVAELEQRFRDSLSDQEYHHHDHVLPIPITFHLGVGIYPYDGTSRSELLNRADERLRRAKTGGGTGESDHVRITAGQQVSGFSMLDALVTAVDNKDRYTRRHSEDVMTYSLMIARELNQNEEMLSTISIAALLHDVGKIGVPDAILRKPGNLTEEEFETIKQHPQMGASIVATIPGLELTLDAVRHHHERWDGEGYPSGLAGREIPFIARLMAVADAFSAMTTDRPYRKGMDKLKALAILERGAGTQWDPECVRAFLRAFLDKSALEDAR